MDCNTCKENRQTVPYIVHESAMVRNERQVRRLVVALVVAIVCIVLCNLAWLYAWMQYDYSSEDTQTVTTVEAQDGIANYIGNDGSIVNGEDHSSEENEETDSH